ncbi:FAD-binding oxidoreductase [Rhizobium sp. RM]|uniref:NAD(P)/FAD-dependent oxidoreductase n=1 Tax=Rhizobium sp. RM TaxID=2748079 RepID=UPI00110DB182|nr:FAD-binding oxidoreductase [Rhizobium sp. RM]NWJ24511.1 FAD-binding oxidoreductase [Rhizobium sp. RM]TMV16325.1 FAD-binding oxidoreductase [Rhizobium sp. Td3]
MAVDVVVLGAGIIGVSVALQLSRRGKSVVLLDRRGPGEETSFGNAGLIQREGVEPYGFPQDVGLLLKYSLNNRIDAHYHLRALPKIAPFLGRYWFHSTPARHAAISRAYAPLIEHSVSEHKILIEEANADDLIVKNGWMEAYRTAQKRDADYGSAERLARDYGISYTTLSAAELAEAEPDLRRDFVGGLKWNDPWSVRDPHALTLAYVRLFESLGGTVMRGDASTLSQTAKGWTVRTDTGAIEAEHAVVALGPWADTVTERLGYRFSLGVKRGYHMHYAPQPGTRLNNWLIDAERGYFLAPMRKGIRLTTGAEFAERDAPKSPVQIERAERIARTAFPLGGRLDAEPWMGSRPCTPDMMPIIGRAPRHNTLWFAFGHAHHGLTLGPITGRVLAETILGETPVIPIDAYRPGRFNP